MYHPNDQIGPYRLERSLGRGGFGEVWLAERRATLLTTHVALKLPLDTQTDLELIEAEAGVWLRASGHPNVVPVLEAEVYDGQVVIASEYVAGGSLADWLGQRGGHIPSPETAVSMLRGILTGLDYLHRNGLIHRDLKPANILLQDGIPRLTDFGLTRVLKPTREATEVAGSPAYMAPESFQGQYSPASDLWAVGVILYRMLAGALPFHQSDFHALILAVLHSDPAPLPAVVPEWLHPIVARALCKSPSERYDSATAMRDAMETPQAPRTGPMASVSAQADFVPATHNNLPLQLTSFIGRVKERADIDGLLRTTRLLTLTGSGGCGKTRLVLQVAADLLTGFSEGVWLVELAALTDPALVPQSVAETLAVREVQGEPITTTLVDSLKDRSLLLLLDNCEHLLEAVARLADTLLRSCERMQILVSSREALCTGGERVYRVPSLSVPELKQSQTLDSVTQYESVQLFVDRASAMNPSFHVTDRNASALALLCHRLDGIPLAIELAAARIRSLTIEQVALRLDDRFRILTGGSRSALPRQQTLRAAIDWSYNLLSDAEKAIFQRLGVFQGGWTLEAAEAIAGDAEPISQGDPHAHIDSLDVLDPLTSLIDKSLALTEARGAATRYRFHESVRHYAILKLRESGEEAVRRERHCEWFAGWAAQTETDYIDPEQENLQAAFQWAQDAGGSKGVPELSLALGRWKLWRGYIREAVEYVQAGLDAASRPPAESSLRSGASSRLTCDLLLERAGLYLDLSEWTQARATAEQALDQCGQRRDVAGQGRSENLLGQAAMQLNETERARRHYRTALALFEQAGDETLCGKVLNNMGILERRDGTGTREERNQRLGVAEALLLQALATRRRSQDPRALSETLTNLGVLAAERADLNAADRYYREAIELSMHARHIHGIAINLANLGEVAQSRGDVMHSLILFTAAEQFMEETQSPLQEQVARMALNLLQESGITAETCASTRAIVRELPRDERVAFALLPADRN